MIYVGNSTSLECVSSSTTGDSISWKGRALDDLGRRVIVENKPESSILRIQNATTMDTGLYTCYHGESAITFNLTVQGKLSLTVANQLIGACNYMQ